MELKLTQEDHPLKAAINSPRFLVGGAYAVILC
jgi:hypothetical protein